MRIDVPSSDIWRVMEWKVHAKLNEQDKCTLNYSSTFVCILKINEQFLLQPALLVIIHSPTLSNPDHPISEPCFHR